MAIVLIVNGCDRPEFHVCFKMVCKGMVYNKTRVLILPLSLCILAPACYCIGQLVSIQPVLCLVLRVQFHQGSCDDFYAVQ